METSLPQRVQISDQLLFQDLGGESVFLNRETERYFGLDDIGTQMWLLLAANGDVNATYRQLLAEYDVAPEQLRADLAALIERFREAGLVTIVAP